MRLMDPIFQQTKATSPTCIPSAHFETGTALAGMLVADRMRVAYPEAEALPALLVKTRLGCADGWSRRSGAMTLLAAWQTAKDVFRIGSAA
jgi:hypothetical protein